MTVIDGCASSLLLISSGVPQGSILGPLLLIAPAILEVAAYRQDYFDLAEKISIFQEKGSQGIAKTSLGVE